MGDWVAAVPGQRCDCRRRRSGRACLVELLCDRCLHKGRQFIGQQKLAGPLFAEKGLAKLAEPLAFFGAGCRIVEDSGPRRLFVNDKGEALLARARSATKLQLGDRQAVRVAVLRWRDRTVATAMPVRPFDTRCQATQLPLEQRLATGPSSIGNTSTAHRL